MTDKMIKHILPQVVFKVPLAPLSTFNIGGVASWLIEVKNGEELVETVQIAKANNIPYYIFAGGSNVVFPDRVPQKLFICFRAGRLNKNNHQVEGVRVEVGAEIALASLIKLSLKNSLQGLESLSGIPGTVGGAVVGNAGAYGTSISDRLEEAQIWDGQNIKWLPKKDCQFKYRSSIFTRQDWLVLRVRFLLRQGNKKELQKKSHEIIKIREQKYAPGLKCPGSFFKNVLIKNISQSVLKNIPPAKIIDGKIPAGYLLEQVGAKGSRQGQIVVPDFHGNLLVNKGGGKAREVVKLANKLKTKVKAKFNITLEAEVKII
ncbi:MAG: UDP-N-acetylmuramate dehydrogenase [Candidatus Paceibacterota bacterium]